MQKNRLNSFRPQVEQLEGRDLMATFIAMGGAWNDAANWRVLNGVIGQR